MTPSIIELKNVSKIFDEKEALKSINLDIKEKEFVTLLGPSGCGKTTTLRIIGGFETASSGEVFFDGVNINSIPPYKRQINTVFQKYALFPHLNIYENIAFGLKIKKVSKNEIDKKVSEMLKLVALEGFEKRSVESLSGGQQQRVAIARALAKNPEILLCDEPTGALDSVSSREVIRILKEFSRSFEKTVIVITHNASIAQTADRVMYIKDGKIEKVEVNENPIPVEEIVL